MSRDFRLLFFSWISLPQASEYTITAISNFFENSQRYSRLKVHHHRWQMEKIFKQKNFNNFVWAPLGSWVNKYINFCLQVHSKVSAAWYFSHYLPPASLTPVAKFAAGVVDTGGAHWLANISRNFKKIWNGHTVIFRGLGEDDSWKKIWSKKSRDTVPLTVGKMATSIARQRNISEIQKLVRVLS